MGDQSRFEGPPGHDGHSRRGRIFVLTLLAVALAVPLGVYETIPVNQHKATAQPPDPTAQAIHDMQTTLLQALDQLKAIQQTVSSDQADTKRLSGQISALSARLEALQQSFASAPVAAAPVAPIEPEPARPKRGAR
jgi:uncharacterized protein HemX